MRVEAAFWRFAKKGSVSQMEEEMPKSTLRMISFFTRAIRTAHVPSVIHRRRRRANFQGLFEAGLTRVLPAVVHLVRRKEAQPDMNS